MPVVRSSGPIRRVITIAGAIAVAGSALALAAGASGAGGGHGGQSAGDARLTCFNDAVPENPRFISKPRRCVLFDRGPTPDYLIGLKKLKWHRFGGSKAVADGLNCDLSTGNCYDTTLVVRSPRSSPRCDGRKLYTRANIDIDYPGLHNISFGIRTC